MSLKEMRAIRYCALKNAHALYQANPASRAARSHMAVFTKYDLMIEQKEKRK